MANKFLIFFIELLKTVAIVFVLAFIIRYFVIQPFVIEGNSMEPDFHDRQLILINKLSYRIHNPNRGDVIVFESPQNHSIYYIKRIIGIPGDEIQLKEGDVYLNGEKIDEPYLSLGQKTTADTSATGTLDVTVGRDQFFVMGDNRDQSSDSREWGLLDKNLISGKFLVVIYPRDSWYSQANQNASEFSQLKYQHSSQS
ncbi:MAG: signal peptidase I [bacterium]|nr:signal peptidase I [bacterium]